MSAVAPGDLVDEPAVVISRRRGVVVVVPYVCPAVLEEVGAGVAADAGVDADRGTPVEADVTERVEVAVLVGEAPAVQVDRPAGAEKRLPHGKDNLAVNENDKGWHAAVRVVRVRPEVPDTVAKVEPQRHELRTRSGSQAPRPPNSPAVNGPAVRPFTGARSRLDSGQRHGLQEAGGKVRATTTSSHHPAGLPIDSPTVEAQVTSWTGCG